MNNNNIVQDESLQNKDNEYKSDCDMNLNLSQKPKKENSKNKAKKIAPNTNQDRNEDLKNSNEGIQILIKMRKIIKQDFPWLKLKIS